MTQRNKETKAYNGGHIETATKASATESPNKRDLNSRYGVMGRVIRPMIQFRMMSDIFINPEFEGTTEERLKDIREQMTFTRAKKTIRKTGWYFTEPYPACGVCVCCGVPQDKEKYGV